MMLFRLNQVPDAFYTQMLNLLGFEPFPASAARADVHVLAVGTGASSRCSSRSARRSATRRASASRRVFTHARRLRHLAAGAHRRAHVAAARHVHRRVGGPALEHGERDRASRASRSRRATAFYLGFETVARRERAPTRHRRHGRGHRCHARPAAAGVGGVAGRGMDPGHVPSSLGDGQTADTTGGLNRDGRRAVARARTRTSR